MADARRTASSLRVERGGGFGRPIGRAEGGMIPNPHAVADADGRPSSYFMTAGQVSAHTDAAALPDEPPEAQRPLGDRGHDADWFRDALQAKGMRSCVPGRKSRNETVQHDKRRYRRRSRIEIEFGRGKDWARVANRCPTVFSAVAFTATVVFWLRATSPDPERHGEPGSGCHRSISGHVGEDRGAAGDQGASDRDPRPHEAIAMEETSPHRRVHSPHVQGWFDTDTTRSTLTPRPSRGTRLDVDPRHVIRIGPVLHREPLARLAIRIDPSRVLDDLKKAERLSVTEHDPDV